MLGLTFSSKLDWGSYTISIAKAASEKIGALICSMKFLSLEVALCISKSTIQPCIEYCSHVWAGSPSCYLELLNQLQKWVCQIAFSPLFASLEPLAYHQNVANLSLFYRYYFGRCSSELAELVGALLVIPIDCMILMSLFLDVTRMAMSTVSSLVQLHPGILWL